MLVWLIHLLEPSLEQWGLVASGDSRVFLTARVALAALTSFLVAWLCGPLAIKWLKARFVERIASASETLNQLHESKNQTPTMGGLFIVGAIVVAALVCADLNNRFVIQSLIVVIGFGTLGMVDDWIKIKTSRRGLTARQKFIVQWLLALLVAAQLCYEQWTKPLGVSLVSPIGTWSFSLGLLFIPWAALVMTGSSNGVNLTDGLDGLAGGCLIIAGGTVATLAYLAGHKVLAAYLQVPHFSGAGELSVLFGAMVGALLGFLWYNCYPAQVFMGDSGSLPTGALLGYGALAIRQEALLVLIGGVFVVETLSVMLQVGWFKWTGRRILLCSPLHNHYVFAGEHELKIVVRFWISSALLAVLALASLKLR